MTVIEGSPVEPAVFVLKTMFLHRKPGVGMHAVEKKLEVEKIPREKSTANTTEIISIDQPYVIRYSIAACDLIMPPTFCIALNIYLIG